jgi:PTH1 family peptidyl-tRNA hydrolase
MRNGRSRLSRFFKKHPISGNSIEKLIVGLGNPGQEYSQNRHNIGFMCLNALAKDIGSIFDKKEGLARTAHGIIGSTPVLLARPQTFMNQSGLAVEKLIRKYRLTAGDLIVVQDDIDLRTGQIRIKSGGRSAGHHGIDSIINELGSADFARVRIGVGRPRVEEPARKQAAVVGFVLDDFDEQDIEVVAVVIRVVVEALKTLVVEGLDTAMNRFNSWTPDTGK